MRRPIIWLVAGLIAGAALSGAAVAAAYDLAANCAATATHIVVDGAEQTPQVSGPATFICHGTAYVPVRFIVGALGGTVSWDGATGTITVSSAGTAATATQVVTFQPTGFTATQTVSGDCWTDSVAAPRAGAYRCMAGNAIFDPCFVGAASSTVDCPDPTQSPDKQTGTVLQLTKALPAASGTQPSPSTPWRFQLVGGAMCGAMTGTIMPGSPYGCAPATTSTSSGSTAGTGGLYCTAPSLAAGSTTMYTVQCATLSSQRAPNGAPQLNSPATYQVAKMWL